MGKGSDYTFQFVFQGTQEQFDFFKAIVLKKVPDSGLFIDFIDYDGFNCSMSSDPVKIFQVGMVLAACYSKFNHLSKTIFSNS